MKAMKCLDIARELEHDIYAGRYRVGNKLPPERELAKTFSAAHLTVREAIKRLAAKGLVTSKQGSGVYVTDPTTVERTLNPLQSGRECVQILGMLEVTTGRVNPVNWGIRMRFYQGVVEAGYVLDLPVSLMDASILSDNRTGVLSDLRDALGLILIDLPLDHAAMNDLLDLGIPIVQMGRDDPSKRIDTIRADTVEGACQAVSHLLELGHRRISFVGGLQTSLAMKQRYDGFVKAHREYEVEHDPSLLLFNIGGLPEDGAQAVETLLNRPDPPTGIFFASDYRAIGAANRLQELGVNVPNAISIVGYDNLPETGYTTPPLTTIDNPLKEMGREALKMLFLKKRDPDRAPVSRLLPTYLVERDSTGPPLIL